MVTLVNILGINTVERFILLVKSQDQKEGKSRRDRVN